MKKKSETHYELAVKKGKAIPKWVLKREYFIKMNGWGKLELWVKNECGSFSKVAIDL